MLHRETSFGLPETHARAGPDMPCQQCDVPRPLSFYIPFAMCYRTAIRASGKERTHGRGAHANSCVAPSGLADCNNRALPLSQPRMHVWCRHWTGSRLALNEMKSWQLARPDGSCGDGVLLAGCHPMFNSALDSQTDWAARQQSTTRSLEQLGTAWSPSSASAW